MTIANRDLVQPFRDEDGALIRELVGKQTDGFRRLSVAEVSLQPGGSTGEHYHAEIEEVYCIEQGCGVMRLDGRSEQVRAGDTIPIAPGTRHQLRNAGDLDLVMTVICAPPFSAGDTFRL